MIRVKTPLVVSGFTFRGIEADVHAPFDTLHLMPAHLTLKEFCNNREDYKSHEILPCDKNSEGFLVATQVGRITVAVTDRDRLRTTLREASLTVGNYITFSYNRTSTTGEHKFIAYLSTKEGSPLLNLTDCFTAETGYEEALFDTAIKFKGKSRATILPVQHDLLENLQAVDA